MKDIFRFTFLTLAEWKKLLFVILVISILTLVEPFPFIGITAYIFEKLLLLSVGVFLIYILRHSKTPDDYYDNLTRNGFGTFMFHFIPAAAGILMGTFLIISFWLAFLIIILQYTGAMFILLNPHDILGAIARTSYITQILIGLYSVYLLFFSYVFLGKLGDALSKESFKASFISIILSLFDFKYWIKTFNLRYFLIYLIWGIVVFGIYIILSFVWLFVVFPAIAHNPNISLIVIPLLVGISVILTYFTYFSAYFAHKTTGN